MTRFFLAIGLQMVFTLLILTFCSCQHGRENNISVSNIADNSFTRKKEANLRALIKLTDANFSDNWILEKESIEEIDHFKNGYVLDWTMTENDIKYVRSYVFELDSQFVSSYEQRFYKDTLISQGPVEFVNNTIKYIQQVIINKKSLRKLNGHWEYKLDGYYYEIYENGKPSCIYKTDHLNHFYMLFEKPNNDKIKLTSGNDCLGLKK